MTEAERVPWPGAEAQPLVERLRKGTYYGQHALMNEAADEIEQLRAEVARCGGDNCMGRRCDDVTNWVTEQAASARVAAERERCARICEAEADRWEGAGSTSAERLCAALIRSA